MNRNEEIELDMSESEPRRQIIINLLITKSLNDAYKFLFFIASTFQGKHKTVSKFMRFENHF